MIGNHAPVPVVHADNAEDRTEPNSDSQMEAILNSISSQHVDTLAPHPETVPLDSLVVEDHHHKQGVRVLVRPLTRSRSVSPGNDSLQWLALRAEVSASGEPEHRVLAVTQTHKDIKFSVRIPAEAGILSPRPPLWCEVYYDPQSDNLILWNRSDVPISLHRISKPEPTSPRMRPEIDPGTTVALSPGTWRIKVLQTAVLDFRILSKWPTFLGRPRADTASDTSSTSGADSLNSSAKRSLDVDDADAQAEGSPGAKRPRQSGAEGNQESVIMFLRRTEEPLVFPIPTAAQGAGKEMTIASDQPLLTAEEGDTVYVDGGCEMDQYSLTKGVQIASTGLSSVFRADHSRIPAETQTVTVKVLKTRNANTNSALAAGRPHEVERNVIRQADMWMREYQSQEGLEHRSIVRLYAGDARHLSLYMEHIEGHDLGVRDHWRASPHSPEGYDIFLGTRDDAKRILRDIAGALNYMHGRDLIHNDIKPSNILYSRKRGAVLCDFGLSTRSQAQAINGGTPYYVPPEFVGRKLRGPPADVWALGITMLYVLRKLPFPDGRNRANHPSGRRLYWQIAELNRRPPRGGLSDAVEQMRLWLDEVNAAKVRLNMADPLEAMVASMLVSDPKNRITMARLMSRLHEHGIGEYAGEN